MFSPLRNGAGKRLREPFGKAGLMVAVIALVFAMLGGAYAATNTGKATSSAKAKKGPRGPKGATGPAGPAGPAGSAGATGPAGPKGDKGDTGNEGKQGPEGKAGKNGKDGSPWTLGGVLPPKATETGIWALSALPKEVIQGQVRIPISLPIPLPAPITEAGKIHIFEGETIPSGCTGTATTAPVKVLDLGADPGNICIYVNSHTGGVNAAEMAPISAETGNLFQVGKAGAFLVTGELAEGASGFGTWAVSAPEE
jgi:hypothetical protein